MSTVYLIHFEKPYQHAKHYLGFTTDLTARIADHRAGVGSRLLQAVNNAGIKWTVAGTWSGNRKFERQLKRRKETPALCPLCIGDAAYKRARKAEKPSLTPVRAAPSSAVIERDLPF